MSEKLTQEELDFLTEEERAALLEDEADGAGEEQEDGDLPSEGGAAEDDADDGADEEDARPEATAKADQVEEDDEPQPTASQQPTPVVPLLKGAGSDDAQAKLDEIKAKKADLAQKFDDGELSAREYSTQLDALDEERDALREAVFKDHLSKEIYQQETQRAWLKDVNEFLSDHPEISRNALTWNSFDMVVRQVTADQANDGMSNAKLLQKAHDLWADQLGISVAAQADRGTKTAAKAERQERKVPLTLAKVPAAMIPETDDGKFAALDRLAETDPDAYEARLLKMSPAELEEYERVSA